MLEHAHEHVHGEGDDHHDHEHESRWHPERDTAIITGTRPSRIRIRISPTLITSIPIERGMTKSKDTSASFLSRARQWDRTVKRDVHAVWLAARDPRTPWFAKWLALAVAAYALSPIDLIPDFIPVIGYLDDIVIVPLGVLLVLRLIPPELMQEHREAAAAAARRPVSRAVTVVFLIIWIACAVAVASLLL